MIRLATTVLLLAAGVLLLVYAWSADRLWLNVPANLLLAAGLVAWFGESPKEK